MPKDWTDLAAVSMTQKIRVLCLNFFPSCMFDLERVSNSDFENGNDTENLPFFKPKHTLVGC